MQWRLPMWGYESSRYFWELWHGLPYLVSSLHGRQLEWHYEGTFIYRIFIASIRDLLYQMYCIYEGFNKLHTTFSERDKLFHPIFYYNDTFWWKANAFAQHRKHRFPHWWAGEWLCFIAHTQNTNFPCTHIYYHQLPTAITTPPHTSAARGIEIMLKRVGRGPLNTHCMQAGQTVVVHEVNQQFTDATSQCKSLSF